MIFRHYYLTTIILAFIFCSTYSYSQIDSTAVINLHNSAYDIELTFPDSAISIYDSAFNISQRINYHIGAGRSLNYKAIVMFEQGRYLEAKEENLIAMPIFEDIDYKLGVAASLVNLGNIELYLGNYNEGMDYYIKGIETYEALQDSARLVVTLNNISSLFLNNQQVEKAVEYAGRAKHLSQSIKDSLKLADSYINLANAFLMKKDSMSYLENSLKAYQIAQQTKDLYIQILGANNMANYYVQSSSLDSAEIYAEKTLELAKAYKNPYNISESLLTLGKVYYKKNEYLGSKKKLDEAMDLANDFGLAKLKLNISHQLFLVEKALGHYEEANDNLSLYSQLKDSINKGETQKYVHLLEQKFENEKKERLIENQQLAIFNQGEIISRNNLLFIAATVILLLLGLAIVLILRSSKQKSKIHTEHVGRLKAEQITMATHSLVEGQEQERKRLSRELHDGVNGGLAAIKLMAANHRKNQENINGFENIETMVEELSTEVREISHNLMPGALAKGSLKDSLEELIAKLNHSDEVDFDLQLIGDVDRGGESIKFYTFRIIQELLSNVLRHAQATECIVQLSAQGEALNLCVEDDGLGMSDENIKTSASGGIGMKNIESRVSYLNGTLERESSNGKGTTFYITIPIA